jgi:hypothetical protein
LYIIFISLALAADNSFKQLSTKQLNKIWTFLSLRSTATKDFFRIFRAYVPASTVLAAIV